LFLAKTVDIQNRVVERSRDGVVGREEVVFIYEFVCEPRSESYMNLASNATSHIDVVK
jgi:hypothetical protein